MRIRADLSHSDWSFVYRRPGGPMREESLYLPKDRPVVLQIVRKPARQRHRPATHPVVRPIPRTIRVDALHRGDLNLSYGPHSTIPADVLGPKAFREQFESRPR
jgi:hypothetical protein